MGAERKTFLPRLNFLLNTCIITEADSTMGTKARNGKTSAALVKRAMTARVTPKGMAPVSPIKNLAGWMLNHKKESNAPTMTAQKTARSYLASKKATKP